VVTSENYAKSSYSLQKFLHKVSIIPIGIHDHSNVEFEQHKIIKYDDLLKSKFVLSVGRLVNYKGFDYLIESFIDTPEDLKLIIIGNGPLRNQLINMINSKKLTHKVFILSDIDPGFLHLFYKSATLFCLPSITRAEAYGVVLVEALSYGLPIVATNINGSGVTFVNRHKITGINVPPKDSQSLALAISRIANSDRLQQYFSIKSRHVFLSTFTAMIFVSRTLNLYEDLFHKSE
jgi:rhamnosyl/mannosyltransferase